MRNEPVPVLQYMVRHHVVMELESLSRKDASTTSSSSRDAPPSGLDASEGVRSLEKTPRTAVNMIEAMQKDSSWVTVPFGEDMEMLPLNSHLKAHTCFRRLYCLRFNVEYTSLPLGMKAFQAVIAKACHEDLTRPADMHGWTATDIAKRLQEENDKHVWPQQLLCKQGQ